MRFALLQWAILGMLLLAGVTLGNEEERRNALVSSGSSFIDDIPSYDLVDIGDLVEVVGSVGCPTDSDLNPENVIFTLGVRNNDRANPSQRNLARGTADGLDRLPPATDCITTYSEVTLLLTLEGDCIYGYDFEVSVQGLDTVTFTDVEDSPTGLFTSRRLEPEEVVHFTWSSKENGVGDKGQFFVTVSGLQHESGDPLGRDVRIPFCVEDRYLSDVTTACETASNCFHYIAKGGLSADIESLSLGDFPVPDCLVKGDRAKSATECIQSGERPASINQCLASGGHPDWCLSRCLNAASYCANNALN